MELDLRCLEGGVCVVVLLDVLFQALGGLYSLANGACCVCLMLSREDLQLDCVISFVYYAATLWFLVTACSQRNDLVCSLAHLVIIIVATVEAELVL